MGILNGVDYDVYNPATDKLISCNYNGRNPKQGKQNNKTALQQALRLPINAETAMIAVISRLVDQKGLN